MRYDGSVSGNRLARTLSRRRCVAAATIAAGAWWFRPAFAQRTYRIAVLIHGAERTLGSRLEALRAGLRDHGYVEGKNLRLSVRWNEGSLERLPELAAELLREKPDVFVGGPVLSAAAAQKHSRTVPIVLMWGAGATKIGLAKSFARPGGNVTGFETQSEELITKHMELLKAIAPGVSRVAVLNTGRYLFHDEAWRAMTQAAQKLKVELVDVRVSEPGELARIESNCGKSGCNGLYVMPDPILINWRAPIIEQAARLRLPAVYFQPEFAEEGGLMSYSTDQDDMCRRAASHVDKILKGAKPSDLPIEHPTRFELVVNLKAARAIGLPIPEAMLLRADKIIR